MKPYSLRSFVLPYDEKPYSLRSFVLPLYGVLFASLIRLVII